MGGVTESCRRKTKKVGTVIVRISIIDLIGTPIFVALLDGEVVCRKVFEALSCGDEVELSFEGITHWSMAFFGSAVGDLLGLFDEEVLATRLHMTHLEEAPSEWCERQCVMRGTITSTRYRMSTGSCWQNGIRSLGYGAARIDPEYPELPLAN